MDSSAVDPDEMTLNWVFSSSFFYLCAVFERKISPIIEKILQSLNLTWSPLATWLWEIKNSFYFLRLLTKSWS
jgi:hypothetical protein